MLLRFLVDVARLLVRVLGGSSVTLFPLNDKNCVSSEIEDSRHFVVGVVNYRRNVILSPSTSSGQAQAKNLLFVIQWDSSVTPFPLNDKRYCVSFEWQTILGFFWMTNDTVLCRNDIRLCFTRMIRFLSFWALRPAQDRLKRRISFYDSMRFFGHSGPSEWQMTMRSL